MSVLEVADIFGMIAFALSGFYVAAKEKLDLLGIFLAAFLTALGGGITRDAIAGRTPFAFTNLSPTLIVIVVVFFAIVAKLDRYDKFEKTIAFIVSDTLGLVSFAIAGALVGIESGFNIFGIIMLGLLTAVGGGAIRDVMLNRVPFFLTSEVYGTVAIATSFAIYILNLYKMANIFVIVLVLLFGIAFRLVAYYKGWKIPKLSQKG